MKSPVAWGNDADRQTYNASYQQALESGSWGVSKWDNLNGNVYFNVWWTETRHDLTMGYDADYKASTITSNTNDIWSVSFGYNYSTCTVRVLGTAPQQFSTSLTADYAGTLASVYFANAPIIYPAGYTGSPLPDSANIKTDIYPDFSYVVNNKTIQATYKGNVPNASHVSWMLYKTDDEWTVPEDTVYQVMEEHISNAGTFNYEVKDKGKYILFLMVESKPPFLAIPDDLNVKPMTQRLEINGDSFVGDTEDDETCDDGQCSVNTNLRDELIAACVKETWPFVDVIGCVKNIGSIGELLSFGTIKSNNQWSAFNGCTNLTVIDDWMNLENSEVCPKIPSYVRSVVTPFVTFALGLTMVRFLSKQGGDGF